MKKQYIKPQSKTIVIRGKDFCLAVSPNDIVNDRRTSVLGSRENDRFDWDDDE